jgi:hypothetical protein
MSTAGMGICLMLDGGCNEIMIQSPSWIITSTSVLKPGTRNERPGSRKIGTPARTAAFVAFPCTSTIKIIPAWVTSVWPILFHCADPVIGRDMGSKAFSIGLG